MATNTGARARRQAAEAARADRIIAFVTERQSCTRVEIAEFLGMTPSACKEVLRRMSIQGLIACVGGSRQRRWCRIGTEAQAFAAARRQAAIEAKHWRREYTAKQRSAPADEIKRRFVSAADVRIRLHPRAVPSVFHLAGRG